MNGQGPKLTGFEFDKNELNFEFLRSPGPGGQNVNKVSTACRLRFNIDQSPSLPTRIKTRLKTLTKNKINRLGELLITSNRHRTQLANRIDAEEKFLKLLQKACTRPKKRIATKPSSASKRRRLDSKTKRGEVKKLRRNVSGKDFF